MTPDERTAWLAARREMITASDVAAVTGYNPYASRARILEEKVSGDSKNLDGMAHVEAGQFLEEGIAAWFGKYHPGHLVHNKRTGADAIIRSPQFDRLGATEDATLNGNPVEVKCVGFQKGTHHWAAAHKSNLNVPAIGWVHDRAGFRREAEVFCPVYYAVQLRAQMHCLNAPLGYVVGLIAGQKRVEMCFHRDLAWEQAVLLPAVIAFWRDVETARGRPLDTV